MITKVEFKNFCALKNVAIKLSPVTIIVGPNGSGKSSILTGILRILNRNGISSELRTKDTRDSLLTVIGKNRGIEWGFRMSAGDSGSNSFWLEGRNWLQDNHWPTGLSQEIQNRIVSARLFRLEPSLLALPSNDQNNSPTLSLDGENLAVVLMTTLLNSRAVFDEIEQRLATIIPQVKKLKIARGEVPYEYREKQQRYVAARPGVPSVTETMVRTIGVLGYRLLFDTTTGNDIPARSMSEGSLVVLALLTALVTSGGPTVLLLEDLERSLHPKALSTFVHHLRELRDSTSCQIVATTHSPYLIDCFDASEVRLTSIDKDGFVSVAALDEHPDFDQWKDVMAPGEFWSSVGEGWVLDKTRKNTK